MPLTEKELLERDAKRNIGEELLAAIVDVKAGRRGAVHRVELTEAAEARSKTGLSQPNSLSCWECRCAPCRSGNKVAARHLALRAHCCISPPSVQTCSGTYFQAECAQSRNEKTAQMTIMPVSRVISGVRPGADAPAEPYFGDLVSGALQR